MKFNKHDSVESLKESVVGLISIGKLNEALKLIYHFVERIITEPLCTSQVFGSQVLDHLCQRIGSANLKNNFTEISNTDLHGQGEPIYVYIATRLQKSGGHTRVIEDFIRSRPESRHLILSTELAGKSDTDYVVKGIGQQANVSFEQAPKGNFQERLTWLQQRVISIRPKKAYLFNHHQDSVAIAAIQPEMGVDVSFYHHGDHHLCLGASLPYAEHIDIHAMAYHCCRDAFGSDNRYIPLTVEDKGRPSSERIFKANGKLTTCTAARSNKLAPPYVVNYFDLIPKLLKVTGGKHIHIGNLTPWNLSRIRRGLARNGVKSHQFVYIPWVQSVWKSLQDFHVDLYINSFPYGGGLTLIEAMGSGTPIVIHNHFFSRVLAQLDLAYPEAFCWTTPDELLEYCKNVTPNVLEMHSLSGRKQYEIYHRREILENLLTNNNFKIEPPSSLSNKFKPRLDEWACWMESQLTIHRVIIRAAYRLFRRLRW